MILRCRKLPEHGHATLTLEDTISPGEATFLDNGGNEPGEALDLRVQLDRNKLEEIAERWKETNAELTITERVLQITKATGTSLPEVAFELQAAGPPLCRELTHTDTPPVTSTDPKTLGETLERLERCAPPGRMACIQSARKTADELWVEMFDDQILLAGQAPGAPQTDPIPLTETASKRMARMLNDQNHYTPGERVVIRRAQESDGLETIELNLDKPWPESNGQGADQFTGARTQWFCRTATPPALLSRPTKRCKQERRKPTASRYGQCASSSR